MAERICANLLEEQILQNQLAIVGLCLSVHAPLQQVKGTQNNNLLCPCRPPKLEVSSMLSKIYWQKHERRQEKYLTFHTSGRDLL